MYATALSRFDPETKLTAIGVALVANKEKRNDRHQSIDAGKYYGI
jgi:hypothetical protein